MIDLAAERARALWLAVTDKELSEILVPKVNLDKRDMVAEAKVPKHMPTGKLAVTQARRGVDYGVFIARHSTDPETLHAMSRMPQKAVKRTLAGNSALPVDVARKLWKWAKDQEDTYMQEQLVRILPPTETLGADEPANAAGLSRAAVEGAIRSGDENELLFLARHWPDMTVMPLLQAAASENKGSTTVAALLNNLPPSVAQEVIQALRALQKGLSEEETWALIGFIFRVRKFRLGLDAPLIDLLVKCDLTGEMVEKLLESGESDLASVVIEVGAKREIDVPDRAIELALEQPGSHMVRCLLGRYLQRVGPERALDFAKRATHKKCGGAMRMAILYVLKQSAGQMSEDLLALLIVAAGDSTLPRYLSGVFGVVPNQTVLQAVHSLMGSTGVPFGTPADKKLQGLATTVLRLADYSEGVQQAAVDVALNMGGTETVKAMVQYKRAADYIARRVYFRFGADKRVWDTIVTIGPDLGGDTVDDWLDMLEAVTAR